ncbi:MAG: AAA family ATPase [Bacillota bacterium]
MTKENRYLEENEHALRLKLHHVVTGRDKELETIKIQFDTVLQCHSAWTVIAGDIGIGKTALVKTALTDMSRLNATCVYGKFEQYKNEETYIPIIQIIENITNHM